MLAMVGLSLRRTPDGRKRGYIVQKHLSSQDWARVCNSASCTSSPALVIFHAQSSCAHLSFRTKLAITFVETPHGFFWNERINAVLGIPMEEVLQVHISSRQCLLFSRFFAFERTLLPILQKFTSTSQQDIMEMPIMLSHLTAVLSLNLNMLPTFPVPTRLNRITIPPTFSRF